MDKGCDNAIKAMTFAVLMRSADKKSFVEFHHGLHCLPKNMHLYKEMVIFGTCYDVNTGY